MQNFDFPLSFSNSFIDPTCCSIQCCTFHYHSCKHCHPLPPSVTYQCHSIHPTTQTKVFDDFYFFHPLFTNLLLDWTPSQHGGCMFLSVGHSLSVRFMTCYSWAWSLQHVLELNSLYSTFSVVSNGETPLDITIQHLSFPSPPCTPSS